VRSVAAQHGISAHGMMRSSLGAWLVASPPMRTGYGVTKFIAFVALALALTFPEGASVWSGLIHQLGLVAAWMATAVCILRGLPVLWEARGLFRTVAGEK
jgi:CDP-diacylglycerol--glycerol-3-phosphate 3-phosphatidyltransferase